MNEVVKLLIISEREAKKRSKKSVVNIELRINEWLNKTFSNMNNCSLKYILYTYICTYYVSTYFAFGNNLCW